VLHITKDNYPTVRFWAIPFYMILNTAIGGSWPGEPSTATAFPTYHLIDYVRVARPVP
jgi:beta-glucanase (GH16 family)